MLFSHKQQLHFRSRSLWIQTLFVCFFWIPSSKMNSAPLLLIPRWTGNKVQASCELVDPLRPPESQNICKPQFVDDRNKVFIPFYYSCCFVIYSAWVYISLDHPAGSIEAFQKTARCSASRTLTAEPEDWFPCCITAQRTVTITRWNLLMIFTFTLRFSLWRQGTTCTLPDLAALWRKEADTTELCLEYSLPLLFYGWMEGLDGFPHRAAQLFWEILITHHEGC